MKRRPTVDPPWGDTKQEMLRECPLRRERGEVLSEARETIPLDPQSIHSVVDFLQAAAGIGFQGRQLGEAYRTWLHMLRDPDCIVFLGISGAVVPAGLGRLVARMIRANAVDVIVTTGAQAYHDLHEASGGYHYHVDASGDDDALRDMSIDRFYNVATDDVDYHALDDCIAEQLAKLDPDRAHSTRAVMECLSAIAVHEDTFVKSAVDCGKPNLRAHVSRLLAIVRPHEDLLRYGTRGADRLLARQCGDHLDRTSGETHRSGLHRWWRAEELHPADRSPHGDRRRESRARWRIDLRVQFTTPTCAMGAVGLFHVGIQDLGEVSRGFADGSGVG